MEYMIEMRIMSESHIDDYVLTNLMDLVGRAGTIAEERIKFKAPVRSGELRNDIHQRLTPSQYMDEIVTNKEYAHAQEFGYTPRNIPEKAYMRGGLDESRTAIRNASKDWLKRGLNG